MLIAFEGIDGAGKTSLSLEFCQYFNDNRWTEEGILKHKNLLSFGQVFWTKHPDFTSEEADKLNSLDYKDYLKREALFLASRLRHISKLKPGNYVFDRYIWSALAYSYHYSKEIFSFLKELYINQDIFKKPDLYIFVDTSIDSCVKRIKEKDRETLLGLWKAYDFTEKYIDVPIIRVKSEPVENELADKSLKIAFEDLKKRFETHIKLQE